VTVTTVPGGIKADYVGLNSLLPCCQVAGQVTIAFTRAGLFVHLEGIQYPDFEAIQYTQDGARFLAQSKMNPAGGIVTTPGFEQFRNEEWLNGTMTYQHNSSSDPRQQNSGDPSDMPCCGI